MMGLIFGRVDRAIRAVNRAWDGFAYRRVTRRVGRGPLQKRPTVEVARWELDALGRTLGQHGLAALVEAKKGAPCYLFGYPLAESAGHFYVVIEERVRGYRG